MKKLFITALSLGVTLTACNSGLKVKNHKDSIEVAVFEGYPVTHDKEFEIEAVFIPVNQVDNYYYGEKVFIDTAGFVVDFPIRFLDGNKIQSDTTDLQRVIINDRILPNKFIKK